MWDLYPCAGKDIIFWVETIGRDPCLMHHELDSPSVTIDVGDGIRLVKSQLWGSLHARRRCRGIVCLSLCSIGFATFTGSESIRHAPWVRSIVLWVYTHLSIISGMWPSHVVSSSCLVAI